LAFINLGETCQIAVRSLGTLQMIMYFKNIENQIIIMIDKVILINQKILII
jgi:hypothetical protein